jgi:hypothetical protein
MAVKQAELARAWGLSRGRISQMVKAGMPLASLEEAAAWRVAHHGGAAIPGKQGGQDKRDSIDNGGADLPSRPEPVKTEDLKREDFLGVLARLKKNELVAWGMLADAINKRNETEIQVRMRQYRDAVDLRVKQEGSVDDILMRRRELVTLAEANELYGRHLQALRMALKNMPTRLAARCNPSDPALAKQVLNEAVVGVFKTMNDWEV